MSHTFTMEWVENPEVYYVKTYGKGRVCAWPGCTTILSQYNPEEYCGAHAHLAPEPKPTDLGVYFKPCDNCGTWKNGHGYSANDTTPDGLSDVCKTCERAIQKAIQLAASEHVCIRCHEKREEKSFPIVDKVTRRRDTIFRKCRSSAKSRIEAAMRGAYDAK